MSIGMYYVSPFPEQSPWSEQIKRYLMRLYAASDRILMP